MGQAWPATPVGLWIWEVQGDRVYSDRSLSHYFGLEEAEGRLGSPINRYLAGIHPDDLERVECEIRRVAAVGGDFQDTYRVREKAGGWRLIAAVGTCFKDADGRLLFPGWIFDLSLVEPDASLEAVARLISAARSWSKQDRVKYVLDAASAELADFMKRIN